ncbi:MerR family transcriptional regulator [Rhodosalinus sp.]|uniref:MerR family transcriptional regulator n=1 Tax=Rhodosalinus sp. TaxID=2047741 RepID=UPI00356A5E27
MSEPRLSFKEMCARFEVTPRTLRYYEYIEILQPERIGRQRFYGPRELARMTLILRGRRYGFQLEDIRQWLLIYEKEGTETQMRTFVEAADAQLDELARQKAQIEEAMDELRRMRDETRATLRSGDGRAFG